MPTYTDAELLAKLAEFVAEKQRVPTRGEWDAKQGPSTRVFARQFGSWSAALSRLGYEPRPGRRSRAESPNLKGEAGRVLADPTELSRLYEMPLSSREIAERLGCSRSTVLNWLRRHGVEPRPAAEGRALRLATRKVVLGRNRQTVTGGSPNAATFGTGDLDQLEVIRAHRR